MVSKKATPAAASKKSAAAPAQHGSYQDMIKEAIINLKERNGSSRQAIKKYVKANNKLGNVTDATFTAHINRALVSGEKAGDFLRPKGPSGTVKLAKKDSKPAAAAAAKPAAKASTTKAPAKKSTTTKAAPKKSTTAKKATTTKAAPKKTAAAAKPKANAGRPRKTAAPKAAPAVEDKAPVVLGKTKSGRVTKTKTPAAVPKTTKAALAKKAGKKATPKKATPKKAEAAA